MFEYFLMRLLPFVSPLLHSLRRWFRVCFYLRLKDILWLEAMGDYVSVHTEEKKYMVYSTMKRMEEKLPEVFMRVHRSYIVNINRINNIDDYCITINKTILAVSRNHKDALMQRLNLV